MTDWGMSGRKDSYTFCLVDPFTLVETGEVVEVEEGQSTITWGEGTDNLCSASIALSDCTNENKLIRVKHGIELPTGETYSETLGTFFVDRSRASALHRRVRRTCDCYSTLWRFTQDVLATDLSKPTGYNIADEVREIIEADGGKFVVMPDARASETHSMDVWWPVGMNKGELLENLANWTGNQLGVNESGFITWSLYVPPESRGVSFEFVEGANCLYEQGFDLEDSRADAVNRVVAFYSSNSTEGSIYPSFNHVTVDLPAYHRFSYENTGRRASYALDVGQPCSEADLRSQAERYLYTNCGAQEFITINHVGIPGLEVGQRVVYTNHHDSRIGLDTEYIIEQISMTLGPGAKCQTKMRQEV